jgi:hypothetical protein
MITVARQGRHRYYRLAGHEVAAAIEALGLISPGLPVRTLRQSREAAALAEARTCYDHLAGRAGVELLDGMLRRGLLRKSHQAERTVVIRHPSASKSPGPERGHWVRSAWMSWRPGAHAATSLVPASTGVRLDRARPASPQRARTAAGVAGLACTFGLDLA